MKCVEFMESLDDLVDGALPEALGAEMERHMESCLSCRGQKTRLESLMARAATLPESVEPGRDLWQGISARIREEGEQAAFSGGNVNARGGRKRRLPPFLAAAAALVLGTVGYLAVPAIAGGRNGGSSPFAYRARPVPASFAQSPGLGESQAAFEAARAELYAALEARRGSLSKETVKLLEKNLRIIDGAVSEIRSALEDDPGNGELSAFLIDAYEREIGLLRQAASLPGSI